MQSIIDLLRQNVVLVGLIMGVVTPLLISVVQQPGLSDNARKWVATAVSAVVGFVVSASQGVLPDMSNFQVTDLATTLGVIGAVWSASEATFRKLWKPSGVTEAVEAVTSPWSPTPPPGDDPGSDFKQYQR